MSAPTNTPAATPDRIMEMVWGYAPPIILGTAVNAKVFDRLDEEPQSVDELAKSTGLSTRGVRMLLNALVGFGFATKNTDGRYALTPESAAFLVSTKPSFLGKFAEFNAFKLSPAWLKLPEVVRSGKPVHENTQEEVADPFFQELVEPIFALSYPATQIAGKALGLEKAANPLKVLDIGAGSGVWGIGLAQQSPKVTATALDYPGVLEVTKRTVAKFGLAERFSYIAGSFREVDFGTGYDIVTLGHILHSEGPEHSRELLKKCFRALAPGGKIVITEFLVNRDRSGPPMALIFAVNMLINTEEGDTYSFEEISDWLTQAGFVNPRHVPALGAVSIIMVDKP